MRWILPASSRGRDAEPVGRFVVVVVHDDDAVEPFEVGFVQRTGAVREFVTASGGGTPHPRIGQVAGVSRIGAGRIGFDAVAQRLASDLRAENLFGGRRAADIAQADKKDSGFHRRTKIVQAEGRTKFIWFCRGAAYLSGACPRKVCKPSAKANLFAVLPRHRLSERKPIFRKVRMPGAEHSC